MDYSEGKGQPKVLRSVTTAKGSKYTYLPDGRTQRFKKVTGELEEPQDVLVFIPPWDMIKDQAIKFYPAIFSGIENQLQYEQLLLEYSQISGRTIRPRSPEGREIFTNQEAKSVSRVFLDFVDRSKAAADFTLPVSVEPKKGYLSFDTKKYSNEKGETIRELHIGNRVVEIEYGHDLNSPGMMR